MHMKNYYFISLFILTSVSFAQIGGNQTFQFLNTSHSAKIGSLGNNNVSYRDNNTGMVVFNPAALNEKMFHELQFNEVFVQSGVKYSALNYVYKGKSGNLNGIGINNLSYEKMNRTDASGEKNGVFYGNETVIYWNKAHTINHFAVGLNAKYAQSVIESYWANALLMDFGLMFNHPTKEFNFGLVMKNAGFQLKSYNGNREPMPFQINTGVTFKPEHMPLRISITMHDLQQFNMVYVDETPYIDFVGDTIYPKVPFSEKLIRHFTIGGELVFSKNVQFRIGYGFQSRREMLREVQARRSGGAGFSYGFSIMIRNFQVEYGKTMHQYAGRPTFISITTNTDNFFKKKNKEILDL